MINSKQASLDTGECYRATKYAETILTQENRIMKKGLDVFDANKSYNFLECKQSGAIKAEQFTTE